ncbi:MULTISPECIES: hypothetical protein [unclassified Thalassospira]|jgi:hypothetical protein|nr:MULTISPECIES: hypothetical protein [unclassified Thalassospira]PXX36253.1 hypothetical protein C7967_101646 [Thalassospira sp. 11-3]
MKYDHARFARRRWRARFERLGNIAVVLSVLFLLAFTFGWVQ